MTFSATDQFDPQAMQAFMRQPEIYWATSDRMAPPPEVMDFIGHLMSPYTWTVAAKWEQTIIGYVQFVQRTSVLAELHVAFHPQARGLVARTFTGYAIARAFTERGLLKLLAVIPSDNRRAVMAAHLMHFRLEGTLTCAIVRESGLRDLLLFTLEKGNAGQ